MLVAATRDNTPDATNCQKIVAIVKAEFSDETLTEECTWQTVVLIPKGTSGKFRAIGLVEVLWKAVTSLLNRRFTSDITLHDVLHRFGVGYGLGNAAIEANLLHERGGPLRGLPGSPEGIRCPGLGQVPCDYRGARGRPQDDPTSLELMGTPDYGGQGHRWELPFLHYHKIMVIFPYLFLVVITQFFS